MPLDMWRFKKCILAGMSVRVSVKVAQTALVLVSVALLSPPWQRLLETKRKGCLWLGFPSTHSEKPGQLQC